MTDDFEEPRIDQSPEFDYRAHKMIHSVHTGELLLEIYEVGAGYHWELVDRYGRTHQSGSDVASVELALNAGAAASGSPLLMDDQLALSGDAVRPVVQDAEQDEWVREELDLLDELELDLD